METNLFSDDVVIIIGAGASVPFGLPTGLGLIDLVSLGIGSEVRALKSTDIMSKPSSLPIARNFITSRLGDQVCKSYDIKIGLLAIKNWVDSQVSDSIDDLVRLNRGKSEILKFCMSYELLKTTHNQTINNYESYYVRKFEIRNFNSGNNVLRNWVHNFINIVRDLFVEKWKTNDVYLDSYEFRNEVNHKVKIISFNYDGILEYILNKCWGETEVNFPKWDEVFEIVHPHGTIGIKEEIKSEEIIDYLIDTSKKIVVVKEPIDDGSEDFSDVIAWRTRARDMIANASQVMAIGFAFAKSNCDLIGLHEKWADYHKSIHYLNFDNNFGLDTRVKRFNGDNLSGVHKTVFYSHSENGSHIYKMSPLKGDYLQITDALMGGFLGEMPS